MKQDLQGTWKADGFTYAVPVALRSGIRVILVTGARGNVFSINPHAFYVVIPSAVPKADEWRVYVEDGALKIRPPAARTSGGAVNVASGNARVGLQIGVMHGSVNVGGAGRVRRVPLPNIALVLPRNIPVQNLSV